MPMQPPTTEAWRVLYADPSGLSWRALLAVAPGRQDAVDAFCPERGNVRSFRLDRMLAAIDPASGEPVAPYAFLQARGRPAGDPADASAWAARLPVAALRSFAAATCGTDRARAQVRDAVACVLGAGAVGDASLAAWADRQWHVSAVELLRGDTHAYDLLRNALAPGQRDACRAHALAIAALAGDAETAAAWAARAESDFAATGPWVAARP